MAAEWYKVDAANVAKLVKPTWPNFFVSVTPVKKLESNLSSTRSALASQTLPSSTGMAALLGLSATGGIESAGRLRAKAGAGAGAAWTDVDVAGCPGFFHLPLFTIH